MKKYDYVGKLIDGRNVAYIRLNNKYGLINEKDEEILPPIYDELKPWYGPGGFFHGILNGEHYSINNHGEILNSVPYSKISPFRIKKTGNIAMAKANGKYAYINKEFQEISSFKYSFIHYAIHLILWKLGIWILYNSSYLIATVLL